MKQEEAETLALQALAFLAKSTDLFNRFIETSGISPQELKAHLRDAEILAGVLDTILGDDSVLLSFCNAVGISPDTLIKARDTLPGGYHIYGA